MFIMKKLIYLCESRVKELNEYEKEHKKISYRTLIKYYDMTPILCNNIINVEECLYDYLECGNIYNEEEDYYIDIFQYYIINLTEWELEDIKKKYSEELIICYSPKLENYVLCVDHFGTSWDYVLTDIEYTTDYEEYEKWEESLESEEESEEE